MGTAATKEAVQMPQFFQCRGSKQRKVIPAYMIPSGRMRAAMDAASPSRDHADCLFGVLSARMARKAISISRVIKMPSGSAALRT